MAGTNFDELCADFEDISPSDLGEKVSHILNAPYLQEVVVAEPRKFVQGAVWGANFRPIISLDVQISESIITLSGTAKPVHVHFLYLQASPQTYLSDEALRAIGIEDMVIAGECLANSDRSMRVPLYINGYKSYVIRSPHESHFAHLNILGDDFIQASKARVFFGGNEPKFAMQFP